MIKVTAQADLRELERAMAKLKVAFRRRTFPEIVNRSAGSIAIKAMTKTPQADREMIFHTLKRNVGTKVKIYRSKKRFGEVKVGKDIYDVGDYAKLAYLKRFPELRRNGRKNPIGADDFINRVRRFVASSIQSAAYLKHGWREVIDIYRKFIKGSYIPKGHKHKSAKTKLGTGTPANIADNSLRAEATLYNRAVIKHESARPILDKALREAVVEETRQLKEAAERAIAQDVKAVGG